MATDQRLEAINAEIARIREAMKASEKRLDDLIKLKLLTAQYMDVFDTGLKPIKKSADSVRAKIKAKKYATKREAIIEGCKEVLADGKRRFARELLVELDKRGVRVGGGNPKSNLASYLSHSDVFEADTKLGGWTLRSLTTPKAKASNARTLPAFSSNGASTGHLPLAGSPREGGLQFG